MHRWPRLDPLRHVACRDACRHSAPRRMHPRRHARHQDGGAQEEDAMHGPEQQLQVPKAAKVDQQD
eukprot:5445817-Pyramimonas_sp.AAC.1